MRTHKLVFLLAFFCSFLSHTQQTIVKGQVLDGITEDPIPEVAISIEGTELYTTTGANGKFSFKINIPLGNQILKVEKVGYTTKRFPIVVNEGKTVDISGITLDFDPRDKKDLYTISISDDNLNSEDDGLTDNISGLLQASKDAFLSAAAFDFSATFFRPRGLDNANGKVLINGVEMNKLFNGRPQWANWGGLNDMQRNQEFTMGMSANDYTFGDLAGTNAIVMRASKYRKGGRVSYASANRSYQGRVMASYSSGLLKNGWAYAILGSRRFGEKGYIQGTLYDANSFFIAIEKQLGRSHSLNLTGIYAQNRRGRSTAITAEIEGLKGQQYNPFWGVQTGDIRSSRERHIDEPILMLNHYWDISNTVTLNTNIAYQFGEIMNTRIDNNGTRFDEINNTYVGGARNPNPNYYQNLPSFFLNVEGTPSANDFSNAFLAQQRFTNNGQLDWAALYSANSSNGYAIYALQGDVNKDNQWTFNTILDAELNDNIKINTSLNYRRLISENFARIEDLLGAPNYLDIDSFAEDGQGFGQNLEIAAQSNIRTPNRIVREGDRYRYNYEIDANVMSAFTQAQFNYKTIDFYMGANASRTTYQRNGLYENGFFPNSGPVTSFGESEAIDFIDYGIKLGLTYKISGRHVLDINASTFTKAPSIRNSFANERQNNLIVENLESEVINAIDASYVFRSPIVKARLTGFYSNFADATEVGFFFTESTASLVKEIITNVERQHIGAELGIEAQVTPTITLKAAASIGEYVYTNAPNVYYSSNSFTRLDYGDGTTNLKNYHVAGGPERAYQIGFEYRDPDYWNIGVTANHFSHAYVDVSALKRSSAFTVDPELFNPDSFFTREGNYTISGFGINDINDTIARDLLQQERFDDYMLVNLVGGKSWRVGNYFLGFFATINNVFNQAYRTGGFEESRRIDYRSQRQEQTNPYGPVFGNRYFYGFGTTYYLNIYLRF